MLFVVPLRDDKKTAKYHVKNKNLLPIVLDKTEISCSFALSDSLIN